MSSSKAFRRLVRKLTVETLWIYIVRLLIDSGPVRAYDIKKRLQEVFGFKVPTITVYSVVYKLCTEGILEQVKVDGDVVYRVTDKGFAEFKQALEFLENILSKLRI